MAASDRISQLAAAAAAILESTGLYRNVRTYDAVALDPLPAASMWWKGFDRLDAEPRAAYTPRICRHRFTLRVFTRLDLAQQQADEEALRALVQETVQAFDDNQTLQDQAIRAMITSGALGEASDGRRSALFCELELSADAADW